MIEVHFLKLYIVEKLELEQVQKNSYEESCPCLTLMAPTKLTNEAHLFPQIVESFPTIWRSVAFSLVFSNNGLCFLF